MGEFLKKCRLTIILICVSMILMVGTVAVTATPAKRSSFLLDDATIRTEMVGLNNRQEVLAKFNLTEAMISRINAGISAATMKAEADGRTSQYFEKLREFRVNDIKNRISNAIHNDPLQENYEQHPLHEMAAYPNCNSETTESSWLQDNNITIQFSQTLFEQRKDLNLDSAILRLYKINPNGTNDRGNVEPANGETTADHPSKEFETQAEESVASKLKRCVKPNMDAQIRVTISLVQQLRRNKRGVYERKKRICNTVMMNVTQTGWVEIDIKRAIYIWEEKLQQSQQTRPTVLVGCLMIEVHDEEEQPLKPGLFFKPPNCNQADIAIPWNYYRPDTAMPSFATHDVPWYPRLDVKMIGYASFAPINQHHTEQDDKLYANLKLRVFNITPESTTYIAPTADNHLDSYDNTALLRVKNEMQQQQQQREHIQHKRHLKLSQLKQQLKEEQEKEQIDNDTKEFRRQQEQHTHHRHHHRQQHDEEHYHQHHHHARKDHGVVAEDKQRLEIELQQQQHDAKLLEHIAHKLLQEEQQLYVLHEQQHLTDAFNV